MNARQDQAAELRDRASGDDRMRVSRRLRCIAVGSGKGGVGKTMVSIGLAYCLARMKYRVLLFDADLGLANVDLQMGLEPTLTVQDVLFGGCSLDDAVMSVPDGPDVLASSSGVPEMVDLGSARRQMFVDGLMQFANGYDFLIIDIAAGIGKDITDFLAATPEMLVVVANEPTSLMDAYSLVKVVCKSSQPPSVMTVVNMVRSLDEGEALAERLNGIARRFLGVSLPLAGVIVYDEVVRDAIRARESVVAYARASAPAKCLEELARVVARGRRQPGVAAQLDNDFFYKLADIGTQTEIAE